MSLTASAASRWDGERLIAEGRQGNMTMHEVMVLSPNRRALVILVTTTTPEGETHNRLVYTLGQPVGPCEAWAMPCKQFPQRVPQQPRRTFTPNYYGRLSHFDVPTSTDLRHATVDTLRRA